MRFKNLFLVIIAFFSVYSLSFAQELAQPPMVRFIYFFPSDRQPQPDIDAKLDVLIKEVQEFFADEMERHGFGRKTFPIETDATGNAVVHHVKGQLKDVDYHRQTWDKVWNEVNQQFDISKNIYFATIDISTEGFDSDSGHGLVCWRGGVYGSHGGRVIIPASGNCFIGDGDLIVAAHELGHAFGLFHDFRRDTYLMSYGRYRNELSQCTAEWLDVHPYFNTSQTQTNRPAEIEVLPPLAAPPYDIRFRFKVTDEDGLHQVQFLTPATALHEAPGELKILGCKQVDAQSETIEFVTSQLTTRSVPEVVLQVIDVYGNFGIQHFGIDISSLLPTAEVISIPDPNLAEVLRRNLGLASGQPITQLDLFRLNELFVFDRQITDLTGIEHARHLKVLSLYESHISDLTPLVELTHLQHLLLTKCHISDLTPLTTMNNLTVLGLDDNQISDITPLAELTNLTWLNLWGNQVSDIIPLTDLTNLHFLNLWGSRVSDITPLADLTNLETLYLGENPISDITPLSGLTNLDFLYLWGRSISDIGPLTGLANLTTLIIGANRIRDITPLAELTNLTSLNLSHNQISDITPLSELTNLTSLNLPYNQISDITPLANLTQLERIWLLGNQIQDITPLVNLENLTALHLRQNPILDMSPLRVLVEKNPGMNLDILPTLYSLDKITGAWLWMIAPTEDYRGGVESIDVDSLAAASDEVVTEADIAVNGAKQGDAVGDYVWRLGEIAADGGNNVNDLVNRVGFVDGGDPATTADDIDFNHHSSYALITLESATDQSDVTMLAGSNDAIKIWLNGEVVYNSNINFTNWASTDFEFPFKVDLKAGDNLLLVKVSEYTGDWSMFVGIDAEVTVIDKATPPTTSPAPASDVNQDGQVNMLDLVLVAQHLGETTPTNPRTDVNDDGEVNILDLLLVATAFGESAAPAAPAVNLSQMEHDGQEMIPAIQAWIQLAQAEGNDSVLFQQGIDNLQRLLASLLPQHTTLLPNYPNPFNPETWIPYQLAQDSEVLIRIYTASGTLVRTLQLGHQTAGIYQNRSRAAYWNGKNGIGEPVASGIYFYALTAGDFNATRKMLIRK